MLIHNVCYQPLWDDPSLYSILSPDRVTDGDLYEDPTDQVCGAGLLLINNNPQDIYNAHIGVLGENLCRWTS